MFKKTEILKFQLALFTTAEQNRVLVYNEDRSVQGEFPATKMHEELFEIHGPHKFYAECRYHQDGKKAVKVEILNIVETQPW